MKNDNLKRFLEMFEAQRDSLVYSYGYAAENLELKPEEKLDEVDWASFEIEQQMHLRLKGREATYLKKVNEAIERIKAGNFGDCEACGEEIDERRLLARPTATQCMGCKEEDEKREHSFSDGRTLKSHSKFSMIA